MTAWERILELVNIESDLPNQLLTGFLIVMRILPIVFLTPFLGGKLVPSETRLGLSLGLALMVFPYASMGVTSGLEVNGPTFILLLFKLWWMQVVVLQTWRHSRKK